MSRIFVAPIIGQSAASGAQVIDGSLKFVSASDAHLTRTLSSNGSTAATFSFWFKKGNQGSGNDPVGYESFVDAYVSSATYTRLYLNGSQLAMVHRVSDNQNNLRTNAVFRDIGWYHVVGTSDSNGHPAVYVNGVQITSYSSSDFSNTQSSNAATTSGATVEIATQNGRTDRNFDGLISNFYFIDGQALGPENFGFTDGLTNTWKPKKYTGTFGTNGFWLPMDGSASIGKDQSGQGNDFTPVNFGGSLELDNPNVSGARPILNTTQGGSQAGIGVFGSKENKVYTVTYADDGGGNKYYIDGVKQATLTGLIRGATYTFDTVALGATHPFRLSATSAHGTEYTNGVKAVTGAATTITIPHNSPDTLYYYCTAHSGMGSSITGITTNSKLADQFASNCILALPLVGVATDVSASIACTSIQKGQSNYGDPGASRAKSVFYDESYYFDGNDALELGIINDTDLEMGSSDFCIEGWFNGQTTLDATYWNPILAMPWHGQDNAESQIWIAFAGGDSSPYSAGEFHVRIRDSSGIKEMPSGLTTLYNDQTWHHFALTKNGTTAALFVDGVLKKTVTTEASLNTGLDDQRGYIASYNNNTGSPGSPQGFYKGYISDLRIYKGVAKYVGVTTDIQYFVPPSTSPDITLDTPSGVAGGSKLAKIAEGAVSFDGSDGRLNLYPNADFAFGTGDFTVECYVYSNNRGTYDYIIDGRNSSQTTGTWSLSYGWSGGNGRLEFAHGGDGTLLECPASFNPETNKWYHIAVTRSGTSLKMFIDGVLATSATNSSNFSTSPTNSSVGTRYSNQHYWDGAISNIRVVKGTALYTSNFVPSLEPLTKTSQGATESEVKLLCCTSNTVAGTAVTAPGMGGVNDGTVWSTSVSGGIGPYANGFDGSTSTYMYPRNQDAQGNLVFAGGLPCDAVYCNTYSSSGTEFFTDSASSPTSVNTSSSFAWVDLPADATVLNQIKGTGGAGYDAFAIAAFRKDGVTLIDPLSPTGGVTASNFTPFNTIDTVRGQETGYCTFNPLKKSSEITLSNGNLDLSSSNTSNKCKVFGTFSVSTGKYYYEVTIGINYRGSFGWATTQDSNLAQQPGDSTGDYALTFDGNKISSGSYTASYGTAFAAGTVIGVRLDADAGNIAFSIDGKDLGNAFTGQTGKTFWPIAGDASSGGTIDASVNFGQKPFKFPPPDGFQPLNFATVRPETVITRSDQYVGISTWTGNSTDNRSIPVGFQPDLVWTKRRDTALDHFMWDSVRGAASELYPNQAYEAGTASPLRFGGFYYDGFIVNNHSSVNQTGNWVAWSWKAGGNKNTFNKDDEGFASAAAAGLTAGTITPVGSSVGTKQGFSIIQYQGNATAGAQVPHGLTQTPDFTIIKSIDVVTDKSWFVGGNWAPGYGRLLLNSGVADNGSPGNVVANDLWNNTAPTSSVVTLGSYNGVNDSGDDYIMYNWHNVPGLQKFGTYTGKSALNYVELGFRPALVILKNQSNSSYTSYTFFAMFDSTRDTSNTMQNVIFAGKDQEENKRGNGSSMSSVADFSLDFLSNGFALRDNGASEINLNTNTYVYAAWAETPTFNLYGGGANAR